MVTQSAITAEEAATLFSLLADPDEEVRTEALRALVHLPLTGEAWEQLGDYLLIMLHRSAAEPGMIPAAARRRVAAAVAIAEEAVDDLPPLPRPELIAAAVYVPLPAVREHLRWLATEGEAADRWPAARALAAAGDRAALPTLLAALQEADFDRRFLAAQALAGLDVSGAEDAVRQALAAEEEPELDFGLALALARAGDTEPLLDSLRSGDIGLIWSIPSLDTGAAATLPPFPERMRARLEAWVGDDALSEGTRIRARELLTAHEPSPAPPEKEAPTPAEQVAAEEAAAETLEQIRALLDGADPEGWWEPDWPSLHAVAPETAAHLVNRLWALALAGGRERRGIGLGNQIGLFVYDMQQPFRPDLPALLGYALQVEEMEPEALDTHQLAWLASRAGLEAVLAALEPALRAEAAPTRAGAARFARLAVLYVRQSFPPMFGGGAVPPSLPPHFDEFGDQVEIGMVDTGGGSFFGRDRGEDPLSAGGDFEAVAPGGEPKGIDLDDLAGILPDDEEAAPEEAAPPSGAEAPVERIVNTGFAPDEQPADLLDPGEPLVAGADYFFWLQIGAPMAASIETEPVPLPDLPDRTRLTVVLFPFRDGLEIRDGLDVGELEVRGAAAKVVRQPADYPADWPARAVRLYFPVRVPAAPGSYRLRCSIYRDQLLLQSRLITVDAVAAGAGGEARGRRLRSDLDYTISNRLDPAHVNRLEPEGMRHRLSLMLNGDGDATHNVHVFGREGDTVVKKGDLRFGEMELAEMIENARQKLRLASWGREEEYREEWEYRYGDTEAELAAWRAGEPAGEQFIRKLRRDLARMAKSGFRFYDRLVDELLDDDAQAFADLLREPATLQVAFRRSIRHLLPAALVYDYRILATASVDQFRLCQTFEQALREGSDLRQTACWQGACPERDAWTVVCPSGFWGFRHFLGMPLTLCDEEDGGEPCPVPDLPAFISYDEQLRLGVGVATDLPLWGEHRQGLFRLQPAERWLVIDDINELLQLFDDPPHLLYFYCHGGLDDGAATLEFGPADLRARIDRTIWGQASWAAPRPLVFINGCHTTAVTPEKAMDLVEPLLRRAHSAGVVGTEITIFEPLATRFAEACFRRFFAGEPIGRALRDARLELLQQGNPLGLVYIPFVLAGLRLVESGSLMEGG